MTLRDKIAAQTLNYFMDGRTSEDTADAIFELVIAHATSPEAVGRANNAWSETVTRRNKTAYEGFERAVRAALGENDDD